MEARLVDPLLTLFAKLIADPARLLKAHVFPAGSSHQMGLHAHDDLLQFDLALGCVGRWEVDGRAYEIHGDTAAVFYPHQVHRYDIWPRARGGGRVFSIKIRVDRVDEPCVTRRWFAEHRPRLATSQTMARSVERLVRLMGPGTHVPMRLVRLQEVLCLWPARNPVAPNPGPWSVEDESVEQAMGYVQAHLNRRVELQEMADHVGLSPRHLSRRFRAATGSSAYVWADGQRARLAQELLSRPDVRVKQVAREMGFDSVQTFSRWFRREAGITPTQARISDGRS
ncbi:MAG TPA: AraC family transcriptional regulator [Tepidisphaeraceae bacterium]|jgi:AraC-like DNA-binding protein|nr:AraC family transcriptional regulator [Tepidisphaeraceae bacterium]